MYKTQNVSSNEWREGSNVTLQGKSRYEQTTGKIYFIFCKGIAFSLEKKI